MAICSQYCKKNCIVKEMQQNKQTCTQKFASKLEQKRC